MADVLFTPRAEADLRGLWRAIAKHNEGAADQILRRISEKIALLSDNPFLGRARDDLRPEMRVLIERHWLILYRFEAGSELVQIVAVIDGRCDLGEVTFE